MFEHHSPEGRNEQNIDLIRQGYDAHRNSNYAVVFAVLHPEVVLYQTELLPWGGIYQGHAGARDFFCKLAEHIVSEVAPAQFIEADNKVAVVGRIHGHARANGAAFDLEIVHLWTVQEGRILRFEAYIDTPQMLLVLAGKKHAD